MGGFLSESFPDVKGFSPFSFTAFLLLSFPPLKCFVCLSQIIKAHILNPTKAFLLLALSLSFLDPSFTASCSIAGPCLLYVAFNKRIFINFLLSLFFFKYLFQSFNPLCHCPVRLQTWLYLIHLHKTESGKRKIHPHSCRGMNEKYNTMYILY